MPDLTVTVTTGNPLTVTTSINEVDVSIGPVLPLKDTHYRDSFTPTNGQTSFTLTYTPRSNSDQVFYNGILTQAGVDYSISGTTLTWAGVALTTTDKILVKYVVS